MDIEEGAGGQADSGVNMVHFVNKLRSIKPDIVIGMKFNLNVLSIGSSIYGVFYKQQSYFSQIVSKKTKKTILFFMKKFKL